MNLFAGGRLASRLSLGFVIASLLTSWPALAGKPEDQGLAIAREADARDAGFGDSRNELTMVLKDQYGNRQERYMRNRVLEQENDGDKSIIIFDNPGNVKGTAFLSYTHKAGPDDQWLYLPSLKRTKRIASSNKAGAFMNSEFAYEDIASQEVEKYRYKYLRDEKIDDRDHFVIERIPLDPESGYSRQEVWIDKDHYRIWKTTFYDRGGSLKKTLTISDYHQYLEKYWRADTWLMVNHQTGKSTELHMRDWQFRNGFDNGDFNKNSLARVR